LEAATALTTCQSFLANTGKTGCDCFNNYLQNADSTCVSQDDKLSQVATCVLARVGCPTAKCTLDCQLLSNLIPDTNTTFQTCWTNNADKCGCYTAAVDKIVDFDQCNTAVSLKLETCVRAQLDCATIQGTDECKATNVTLSISTIKALLDQYSDKFKAAWNNGLAKLTNPITVDTVTQKSDSDNSITITISVTYTDPNIQDVIDNCKKEIAITIGLREEDLHGKEVQSSKRGVLSSSTLEFTGTQPGSSGASSLTIVLLPLVSLISAMHYYF